MYSVLIVDDEEPVLESYSFLITSFGDDFSVCGTARSGNEALNIAHEKKPDIILMDIAMPGMDGLDTIRELQRELPDSLYILSTAYERFDLAQRAIPLRVFAYLVKPVSKKRFLETLFRAKDQLDKHPVKENQGIEDLRTNSDALHIEERNFLQLITWKALDKNVWTRYCRLFQFSADSAVVLILDLDDLQKKDAIVKKVRYRYRCLSTEYLDRLLLLILDPVQEDILVRYVREILTTILPDASSFAIGVGTRRRYDELFRACDEAFGELGTRERDRFETSRHFDRISEIRRVIAHTHDIEEALSLCSSYWEEESLTRPFPVVRSRMVALFTLLLDDLRNRVGQETESVLGDPALAIASIETRQELEAWARRSIRIIVERGTSKRLQTLPQPLQKAVRFIEENYTDPIQLSALAEHCNVSNGYLSRLFSDHLQTSFNDYCNSVRLVAAEELLGENRLSVKEIAYAVGYHDPNYFSRIFKKFKGISPTSFLSEGRDDHEK